MLLTPIHIIEGLLIGNWGHTIFNFLQWNRVLYLEMVNKDRRYKGPLSKYKSTIEVQTERDLI